jgi:hypothetical protein
MFLGSIFSAGNRSLQSLRSLLSTFKRFDRTSSISFGIHRAAGNSRLPVLERDDLLPFAPGFLQQRSQTAGRFPGRVDVVGRRNRDIAVTEQVFGRAQAVLPVDHASEFLSQFVDRFTGRDAVGSQPYAQQLKDFLGPVLIPVPAMFWIASFISIIDNETGTGLRGVTPEDAHQFGIDLNIPDRVLGLGLEVPGQLNPDHVIVEECE